jgi:hypothetical protein
MVGPYIDDHNQRLFQEDAIALLPLFPTIAHFRIPRQMGTIGESKSNGNIQPENHLNHLKYKIEWTNNICDLLIWIDSLAIFEDVIFAMEAAGLIAQIILPTSVHIHEFVAVAA